MSVADTINGFRFDKGPYLGKSPADVPPEYLRKVRTSLTGVPEGDPLHEAYAAVSEELRARGLLANEAPAEGRYDPKAFQVPPPIPAAEAARRAVAATRERATVISQETLQRAQAIRQGPAALMPCGHPTEDLRSVEGSWKGSCRGCARLERARMAIVSGLDAAEALLAFEAEIRGYKPEDES